MFYAIECVSFVCIIIHVRRCSLEQLVCHLQRLALYVRRCGSKPIILAGDWNSSFGTHSQPHIGPFCGDPRSQSALLLHFAISLDFLVVNSWQDLGHTRRPPASRPHDQPSMLDWILVRDTSAQSCKLLWPADWAPPATIKSDHALLYASSSSQARLPCKRKPSDPVQRLRSWKPPSDLLENKILETDALTLNAWTWTSSHDPSYPTAALLPQYMHAPQSTQLEDSLDIVSSIAQDLQTDSRLELQTPEDLLKHLCYMFESSSMRYPAQVVRTVFPHVNLAQTLPATIKPILCIIREARRSIVSVDQATKHLRNFVLKMESFVLRAMRRKELQQAQDLEHLLIQHRQRSRTSTPVQCILDQDGNSIQPVDVATYLFQYYSQLYNSDTTCDVLSCEKVYLTRDQLLRLASAAAGTKLRGNLPVSRDGLTAEIILSLHVEQLHELCALATSPEVLRPASWCQIPVSVLRKPRGLSYTS